MLGPGGIVVDVSETKAEKLASVLGYRYLTVDESPSEPVSEPVNTTPRKPGRPKKV